MFGASRSASVGRMLETQRPNLESLRAQFPALAELGPGAQPYAFFDGPAGTHVPQSVIEAIGECLKSANANTHGAFETSRRAQEVVDQARLAAADFVGGHRQEIVFGPNMTTLTFAVSRALGRAWGAGAEIIVTQMDHDANVTPWQVLAESGIRVHECCFDPVDCTLDLAHLESLVSERTRLVAVGLAQNTVGTINPVAKIAAMAHQVGAQVWVDAVHAAPHMTIDVRALGADYLVCSAYKFYGPHVGILWGRRQYLEALEPYRLRPASPNVPDKFETGTPSIELLAGVTATIDYLAAIGRPSDPAPGDPAGRRDALGKTFESIAAWERPMARQLIDGLLALPGVRVFGITSANRQDERCPTVAFRVEGTPPAEVARRLGEEGICVWDGNNYALGVTTGLGLEDSGGVVRAGIVHYNTPPEVERLLGAVARLALA